MEIKKQIYENAFHHYNRALGILGSKKDNPELWDILTWELSTSTFTWAQLMMDNTDDFVSIFYQNYCRDYCENLNRKIGFLNWNENIRNF